MWFQNGLTGMIPWDNAGILSYLSSPGRYDGQLVGLDDRFWMMNLCRINCTSPKDAKMKQPSDLPKHTKVYQSWSLFRPNSKLDNIPLEFQISAYVIKLPCLFHMTGHPQNPDWPSMRDHKQNQPTSSNPSGKRIHSYGKSPFLMGKLTISKSIFPIAILVITWGYMDKIQKYIPYVTYFTSTLPAS